MTSASTTDSAVPSWRRWGVFMAMVIGIFTIAFNTTCVVNAMVPIRDQFHLSPTNVQWIINAYMLAVMSCVVFTGLLGDRFGRRKMFYLGSVIFAAGLALTALSNGEYTLLVGRVLQGIGASILMPGTLAIMAVYFPPEKQNLMNAAWASGIGFGFGLGPAVSGAVSSTIGWEYLFWITFILIMSAAIILFFCEDHQETPNKELRVDFIGIFFYLIAVVPFAFAVVNSNDWGWGNSKTIGLFVPGVFFLLVLPLIEHAIKKKPPLLDFSHFKIPLYAQGCLGMFASGYALMCIFYFMSLSLQSKLLFDYNVLNAGLALMPCGAGLLIGALIAPKVRGSIGPWIETFIVFALNIIALVWLMWESPYTPFVYTWVPFVLSGFGLGMGFASFPRMAIGALSKAEAGRSSSLVNLNIYLGAILSTALGSVFAKAISSDTFNQLAGGIAIPSSVRVQLDHALLGHTGLVDSLLSYFSGAEKQHLISVIGIASWDGVRAAMSLGILVCVLALLGTAYLRMRQFKLQQ